MQLVVHTDEESKSTLIDAVDRPLNARPWDFDDHKGTEAKTFGTLDLLNLAYALVKAGYAITDVDVRDANFEPFPETEALDYVGLIKSVVTTGSFDTDNEHVGRLETFLLNHGVVFNAFTVRSRGHNPERFTIDRDGVLTVRSKQTAQKALDDFGPVLGYEHRHWL